MELKYFGSEHRLLIEHITSNLMIVDLLMKEFPSKIFGGHVENMGMNYNILLMYIDTLVVRFMIIFVYYLWNHEINIIENKLYYL